MEDFQESTFEYNGLEKTVYKLGGDDKPAVLLLLEIPGMTRHTLEFARRLHRDGFTVYLPLLFGKANSPYEPGKNLARLCIQKEFNLLAYRKQSFISEWLRALCREIQKSSQRKIGAIGMCFTGSFVVSLMIDDSVAAPVMSQPGYLGGFIWNKKGRSGLGIPDEDIEKAVARSTAEDIKLLGFRFTNDIVCPKQRFDEVAKRFGDNFIRFEIDNSLFNKHNISPAAHAVHTIDYRDKPGHPTRKAYDTLIEFLNEQLGVVA